MEDNLIRQAFSRVKHDIIFLQQEILNLKNEFSEIKSLLQSLNEEIKTLKNPENQDFKASTLRHINSTHPPTSTHSSTVPQEIRGLKTPNLGISTGNGGVSTDRQTDTSTDKKQEKSVESDILRASEILDSLDLLKKEIRLKFKRITAQEMAVFSTIYQLEEENPEQTTYKNIANLLKLSESSIRDYVQRMVNKGIPIKKKKLNNKKITLSISQDLKKIATLPTIIQLREL
jgi:DNA-binding MarR family transcriptional regulator